MITQLKQVNKSIDKLIIERYLTKASQKDIDQNYCDSADTMFQFTLNNITKQPQTITLFNGIQLSPITNTIQNTFDRTDVSGVANVNSLNAPFYDTTQLTYTLQGTRRLVTYDINSALVADANLQPFGVSAGIAIALDTQRGRVAVLEETQFFVFDINNGVSLVYSVVTSGILNRDIIYSAQTDTYYIVGVAAPNQIGIFNAVDGSLVSNITPAIGAGGAFAGQYLNMLNGKVYFPDDRENNSRVYVLNDGSTTGSFITTTNTRNKSIAVNSDDNVVVAIDGKSPTSVSVINAQTDTEITNYTGLPSGGASFSIYYNNWTKQYLMGVTGRIYIYDTSFNEIQNITATGTTISISRRPFGDVFAINTGSDITDLKPNITQGGIQINDLSRYNYFNNTLNTDVKKLYCSNVIVSDENQLSQPLQFTKKDANGQEYTMNYFPSTKVSVWQNRGRRALAKTAWVILDTTTTLKYVVNPLTSVTFLLHYDDWKMIDFVANTYNVKYNFAKKPVIPKQCSEKNDNFVAENPFFENTVVKYKRVRGVTPILGYKKELVFVPVGDLNFCLSKQLDSNFNRG
jgi:hypothetical protein